MLHAVAQGIVDRHICRQQQSAHREVAQRSLEVDGYGCTQDCSGHEAGYDWAEQHDITDPDDCGGDSDSFIEGCRAYGEALLEKGELSEDIPILKKDIFGNNVYTMWKWIVESEWVTKFTQEHPKVSIYNATEGGIGFADVPNITLEEAAQKLLRKDSPLQQNVNKAIENASIPPFSDNPGSLLDLFLDQVIEALAVRFGRRLPDEPKIDEFGEERTPFAGIPGNHVHHLIISSIAERLGKRAIRIITNFRPRCIALC